MRRAGAHCIAQEASSCVVFGMPQEALRLGGAQQALRPPEIADLLLRMMPQEQRR
jgi:two-component system chemotaxis response regulator CheB